MAKLFSESTDKRAYEQEWGPGMDAVSGISRPAGDARTVGHNTRRHLGVGAELLYGRAVDGVAYNQCYKVFFERGRPPIPCTFAGMTSFLPVGARQANSLVPGAMVWVIKHPLLAYGVIVAVEPPWSTDPTLAMSDFVHQSSRCGLRVDGTHNSLFKLDGNGSIVDWSAGRPFDGTLGGEWGAITETGTRVLLDSFMAQLGTGELTSVTAFYHDDLLRVAGYNLQVITAGSEEETLHDEGEICIYRGETPYPWEQAGSSSPGVDPFRDLTARQSQLDQPHYAAVEPRSDDQQPIHRVVRLGGYAGQGMLTQVQLPTASAFAAYDEGSPGSAVFEETTGLTGQHVVRSAKGIFLVKQPAIPGVKRRRRAESPAGDTAENYRFAGRDGGGPAHEVAGSIQAPDGDPADFQPAAGLLDAVSYATNWQGVHAVYYHKNDWTILEESGTPAGTNQRAVGYAALGSSQFLATPSPSAQHVDHRYGDVDYYPNTSVIGLLDDGGVVISGGNGESITLANGQITLSAPGDIALRAGRDAVTWAGYDVILRAKNAVDVSATTRGVRVKAETDLQLLGGNGGQTGAVLIESRAPSSYGYADRTGDDVAAGGIQLKCARGDVVAWASNIYLRTGGGGVDAGAITLDAGKGKADIFTYSRDVLRFIAGVAEDNFGDSGNVTKTNLFSAQSNVLGAGLVVCDFCEVTKGGLAVRGNIEVDQGHIFTQFANLPLYKNLVGGIEGKPLVDLEKSIQQGIDAEAKLVKDAKASWQSAFQDFWYGKDRAGADATIAAAGFSFRTTAQYRTADFRVFEDRWQQAARLSGGVPATWTEKPVQSGSTVTYPYPGKERWKDAQAYCRQDLTLFDAAAGVSKPRDPALYGSPKYATPAKVTLDGNYAVII